MQRGTSFGRMIRQRRKALDLTQTEFARQVGCAEITIRKIEADTLHPSRQFLARLADQLGIAANERTAFLAAGRGVVSEQIDTLPTPPNPLIGRVAELVAICGCFHEDGVRLLTLTGPGGAGKTRLSLAIAHELADTFRDGVCFVPLAALVAPERVGMAIGQALGLRDQGDNACIDDLLQFLRTKTLLLVLDNFEQVVGAAPLVTELLARCSHLRVLVTSRVALHISGEHEFAVPPLALPTLRSAPIANLNAVPAVALFVARAHAVRADFVLTSDNAPTVADICARLDGLPLAIELAAAWIKLLTPNALLARLTSAQLLHMLVGGARDLPARQQTLRNTVAWSYDLLAPAAQHLFRALSVCVGGCTLEVAEALAVHLLPAPDDRLTALAALVDGSLLRQEPGRDDAGRVMMLEIIREYALELLTQADERADMRQRHAHTFLALAEMARPHLLDEQQEIWLERLEADHENLRAALEWSRTPAGDTALGVRLAEALWEFWLVRGYVSEGRAVIKELLDLHGAHMPSLARARLLTGAGRLAWAQNDWHQAAALLQQSQVLCATLGDSAGSACALNYLGEVAEAQGDYPQAAVLFAQSLALFQQRGDRKGSASALVSYGQMMQAQGQHDRAAELVSASLIVFEEFGDQRGLAVALTVQGQVLHTLGDYVRANTLFSRSLALFRILGYRHGMSWALTNQGQTAMALGEATYAEHCFATSMTLYEELGDRRGQAWAMANQGHAAEVQGDRVHALALLERSVALFDTLGDQRGYAWALYYCGRSVAAMGEYTYAAKRFAESLRIFHALHDSWFCAECLVGLAHTCTGLEHPHAAAQLFAAADAMRAAARPHGENVDNPGDLAHLRQALGEATFAAEWAAGHNLTVEGAIALTEARLTRPENSVVVRRWWTAVQTSANEDESDEVAIQVA